MLALAAAVLAVALGSAGCGSVQAGSAAVVDGHRISVADLQQATDQIHTISDLANASQSQVLLLLVIEPYLSRAASSAGIGVSDSDAETAVGKVGTLSPSALAALRSEVVLQRAQSELTGTAQQDFLNGVVGDLKAASITINPRYGHWDRQKLNLVAADESQPNWLRSTKAPTAQSTAPATG